MDVGRGREEAARAGDDPSRTADRRDSAVTCQVLRRQAAAVTVTVTVTHHWCSREGVLTAA